MQTSTSVGAVESSRRLSILCIHFDLSVVFMGKFYYFSQHFLGCPTSTPKSKLMHEIESYLEDSTAPTDVDVCNISSTYTEESSLDIWSTSSGTAELAYLYGTASTPCM